jgi:hypothetical protein
MSIRSLTAVNRTWRGPAEIGANDPQTDMGVVQIRALNTGSAGWFAIIPHAKVLSSLYVGESYDVARTIRVV